MGNFFNLGDYLDPIARIWGGGETNLAVFRRGREEAKKEADSPEIKEDSVKLNKNNLSEDGPAK
jgi:hypothetical protein